MQAITIFLASFSGALGILIGIIVSSAAATELKIYKETFCIIRNYLFLFAASILLFQLGIIVLIIGLFLLIAIINNFSKEDTSNTIILIMIIMLIITNNTPLFTYLASILLLIGILEAGYWSSTQEKLLEKGLLKKEFLSSLLHSHKLYLLLPFANIIFLL
jgi:hypothetical protein